MATIEDIQKALAPLLASQIALVDAQAVASAQLAALQVGQASLRQEMVAAVTDQVAKAMAPLQARLEAIERSHAHSAFLPSNASTGDPDLDAAMSYATAAKRARSADGHSVGSAAGSGFSYVPQASAADRDFVSGTDPCKVWVMGVGEEKLSTALRAIGKKMLLEKVGAAAADRVILRCGNLKDHFHMVFPTPASAAVFIERCSDSPYLHLAEGQSRRLTVRKDRSAEERLPARLTGTLWKAVSEVLQRKGKWKEAGRLGTTGPKGFIWYSEDAANESSKAWKLVRYSLDASGAPVLSPLLESFLHFGVSESEVDMLVRNVLVTFSAGPAARTP